MAAKSNQFVTWSLFKLVTLSIYIYILGDNFAKKQYEDISAAIANVPDFCRVNGFQ